MGRECPLKKEMTTHSGIPAWKISWTEEPGRLHGVAKLDVSEGITRLSPRKYTFSAN